MKKILAITLPARLPIAPPSRLPITIAALLTIAITSCSKVPIVNPPIPITVLHTLEQFPFQAYLDSIQALAPGIEFMINAGELQDPKVQHAEVPGQCESAFAFRSSTSGAVTSLGVLEPSTGYVHEVTLWDSATGQVLADTWVKSLDSGHWTYYSLALFGEEVPIQANHGYIVGFNTLAVGSEVGDASVGNDIYVLYGPWDYRDYPGTAPGFLPIYPIISGPITYEGQEVIFYDTPISVPPFPGTTPAGYFASQTILGVCDIGFIPEP
jgi:hypothetical protein